MKRTIPLLVNLVIYQCLWFGAVLLQGLFILPALILLGLHLSLCKQRRIEVTIIATCGAIGVLADSIMLHLGLYVFEPTPSVLGMPLWLVVIWAGFAGTLRHSLRYFMTRPLVAMIAAGVGAPLSYLGAAGLGAVTFPMGEIQTTLIIGLVWVVLMRVFVLVVTRLEAFPRRVRNDSVVIHRSATAN